MAHTEAIKPGERLAPSLGGTGYLPPAGPSGVEALIADLTNAQRQGVDSTVWKVRRDSNKHPWQLTLPNGRRVKCAVIGGTGRDWWFVRVSISDGLAALRRG